MKRIICLFFLIDSLFLYGQSTPLDSVLTNVRPATVDLITIYNLDVLSYFNLNDSLNTDLRKELYFKSKEYVDNIDSLKRIKSKMLSSYYYIKTDVYDKYDIVKRGFSVTLSSEIWFLAHGIQYLVISSDTCGKSSAMYYSDVLTVCLLPIKPQLSYNEYGTPVGQTLFIPMDETKALAVENGEQVLNKQENEKYNYNDENISNDVVLYMIFEPTGVQQVSYYDNKKRHNDNILKADKVEVVLANQWTGQLYFVKTYTYKPPIHK